MKRHRSNPVGSHSEAAHSVEMVFGCHLILHTGNRMATNTLLNFGSLLC